MPTMPKRFRAPGHRTAVQGKREHDAHRRQTQPWRREYGTPRWKGIRRHQLTIEPCCRKCAALGRVTIATVCDHVEPHRGDMVKFYAGPFQSLCKPCHDRVKQAEERAAAAG